MKKDEGTKPRRQEKIREIVENHIVETQEELTALLRREHIAATQATVSRDIRELRLSKIPAGDGKQKYEVLKQEDESFEDRYIRILKDGFLSMDMAQNILVIKTVSGMAMAVAAALDSMECQEIVGSIAGDDTIMCAIRTVDDTAVLMERLRKMLEEP